MGGEKRRRIAENGTIALHASSHPRCPPCVHGWLTLSTRMVSSSKSGLDKSVP